MKKISILMLIITAFVVTVTAQNTKEITLEDVWKKFSFYPASVDGINSMNDGINYTVLENGLSVVKYEYKTGKKIATLIDVKELNNSSIKNISEYEFSSDESKLIFSTDVEPIYRHSFKASYYVYDIKTKELKAVSENGKQQLAKFSHDGKKVAFVRDNNMFIKDLISNEEYAITNDGKQNEIINGALDWVYEEEFNDSQANFLKPFIWSADGSKIAYYKFDESDVREFNMTMYGPLYPEWYKFKYPKAGEKNSIVTVHIYDIKSKKTVKVDTGNEAEQYIPRIMWTKNENVLCVLRLNRLQNKLEMLYADANTGNTSVSFTEEDKYYVEVTHDDLTFLNDGKTFITSSERDGYNHLYLFDINGTLIRQITKGEWDVTKFYGYDEKTKLLYYESAEVSPVQRQVYSIDINGNKKTQLTTKSGKNEPYFSNGFKYFINIHSDANSPYMVTLNDSKGKEIREFEVNKYNKVLMDKMKEYGFAKKEFLTVTTEKNLTFNAWMIKPTNFDASKKYPVFFYVYGGPGHQTVMDEWDYDLIWHQMLAQKGYIVVSVDVRGSGARGAEFKKVTYGQLGKYETIDLIDAAKYFGTLPYVDKDRIGIQGWSYGGYMSSLCLAKGADVFKMAIAVAPVINWRYYDSVYTERYMGLPKDNADGYDDNSPINHVDKIKGKYLLVHGSADDNVHFQNSMEMVDALVKANIPFDMQFYTNKNHGIYGGNTRLHLFTKMTSFILENL